MENVIESSKPKKKSKNIKKTKSIKNGTHKNLANLNHLKVN